MQTIEIFDTSDIDIEIGKDVYLLKSNPNKCIKLIQDPNGERDQLFHRWGRFTPKPKPLNKQPAYREYTNQRLAFEAIHKINKKLKREKRCFSLFKPDKLVHIPKYWADNWDEYDPTCDNDMWYGIIMDRFTPIKVFDLSDITPKDFEFYTITILYTLSLLEKHNISHNDPKLPNIFLKKNPYNHTVRYGNFTFDLSRYEYIPMLGDWGNSDVPISKKGFEISKLMSWDDDITYPNKYDPRLQSYLFAYLLKAMILFANKQYLDNTDLRNKYSIVNKLIDLSSISIIENETILNDFPNVYKYQMNCYKKYLSASEVLKLLK